VEVGGLFEGMGMGGTWTPRLACLGGNVSEEIIEEGIVGHGMDSELGLGYAIVYEMSTEIGMDLGDL
jgi:hypothetical protein